MKRSYLKFFIVCALLVSSNSVSSASEKEYVIYTKPTANVSNEAITDDVANESDKTLENDSEKEYVIYTKPTPIASDETETDESIKNESIKDDSDKEESESTSAFSSESISVTGSTDDDSETTVSTESIVKLEGEDKNDSSLNFNVLWKETNSFYNYVMNKYNVSEVLGNEKYKEAKTALGELESLPVLKGSEEHFKKISEGSKYDLYDTELELLQISADLNAYYLSHINENTANQELMVKALNIQHKTELAWYAVSDTLEGISNYYEDKINTDASKEELAELEETYLKEKENLEAKLKDSMDIYKYVYEQNVEEDPNNAEEYKKSYDDLVASFKSSIEKERKELEDNYLKKKDEITNKANGDVTKEEIEKYKLVCEVYKWGKSSNNEEKTGDKPGDNPDDESEIKLGDEPEIKPEIKPEEHYSPIQYYDEAIKELGIKDFVRNDKNYDRAYKLLNSFAKNSDPNYIYAIGQTYNSETGESDSVEAHRYLISDIKKIEEDMWKISLKISACLGAADEEGVKKATAELEEAKTNLKAAWDRIQVYVEKMKEEAEAAAERLKLKKRPIFKYVSNKDEVSKKDENNTTTNEFTSAQMEVTESKSTTNDKTQTSKGGLLCPARYPMSKDERTIMNYNLVASVYGGEKVKMPNIIRPYRPPFRPYKTITKTDEIKEKSKNNNKKDKKITEE